MFISSNDDRNMKTPPPKVETPTPLPSSSAKLEFHIAFDVSNIGNNISIMLDMESDRYDTWEDLFHVHAHSHRALRHIIPSDNKLSPHVTDPSYDQWATLDATILQ